MPKAKYDRLAGGKRKPIQLLPTAEQHQRIRLGAAAASQPIAHFVLEAALAAAEKKIQKIS
jgi:uncharacterized protein (DUF1778 family)